jgi:ribonuclease D
LKKIHRQEWLKDEWEKYCQKAVRDNKETERWRKIKGVGNLDRRQLAIAREVYEWRESRAESLNRPSRFLLRDDLILEIARRTPRSPKDLETLRGISSRDTEQLYQAYLRGMEIPEDKLPKVTPREPDLDEYTWVVQIFSAVMASICKQNSLHPALVATQSDLKWLVKSFKSKKTTGDSILLKGWRRDLFYQTFQDLWDGRQAMRLKREKRGFSIECTKVGD